MDRARKRRTLIAYEGWHNTQQDDPRPGAPRVIGVSHSMAENVSAESYRRSTGDDDYDGGPRLLPSDIEEVDNDAVNHIFNEDLNTAIEDAQSFLGNDDVWDGLSDARREVLVDMAYQMGLPRLNGFEDFRQELLDDDFEGAVEEMEDSDWAEQTPDRAEDMMRVMEENSPNYFEEAEDPYGGG